MTLHGRDGSTFSWEIANAAPGRFEATYRVERSVDGQAYSEGDRRHTLSRDTALGWLRAKAAMRGFDGREIK